MLVKIVFLTASLSFSSGQNTLAELHQKLTLLTTQQTPAQQEPQNQVNYLQTLKNSTEKVQPCFFSMKAPHDGIHLDLQKQLLSGVNSPAAVSSPSCEVRSELVFPSLPLTQPAPLQHQQSIQEPSAKVTPKISHLSELDQQLSKLHNQRPVLAQQGQQPMSQTYSEAVRMSPTTTTSSQSVSQMPPVNPVQNIQAANQVVAPVASTISTPTVARKLSRFVISKVSEESKAQPQPQQSLQPQQSIQTQSTLSSPESDQQMIIQQQQQNIVQSPTIMQPSQQNQAQMFFQQHHGGVVSSRFALCCRH